MQVSDILKDMQGLIQDNGSQDYLTYYKGQSVIAFIANNLLGYIAVLLIIGIPIIVSFELFYINIPVLSNYVDKLVDNSKAVEKIMGLCLRDARVAIYNANTVETGRSANYEYLRIKLKHVCIAIIIAVLLLGPIKQLILYFASIIVKVFNVFDR